MKRRYVIALALFLAAVADSLFIFHIGGPITERYYEKPGTPFDYVVTPNTWSPWYQLPESALNFDPYPVLDKPGLISERIMSGNLAVITAPASEPLRGTTRVRFKNTTDQSIYIHMRVWYDRDPNGNWMTAKVVLLIVLLIALIAVLFTTSPEKHEPPRVIEPPLPTPAPPPVPQLSELERMLRLAHSIVEADRVRKTFLEDNNIASGSALEHQVNVIFDRYEGNLKE